MVWQGVREHVRRETRLAVYCSWRLGRYGSVELARLAIEHDGDLGFLAVIRRSLGRSLQSRDALEHVRSAVVAFVTSLQRHMEAQESDLFPLIERLLVPPGAERLQRNGGWSGPIGSSQWSVAALTTRTRML